MKKLFLACLASTSLLAFSSCDSVDDYDDEDHDEHRHYGGSTTTTTTEETTVSRRVPGIPASTTVETQTTRSY